HPADPARPAAHRGRFGPARAGPGPDAGAPSRAARHRPELPAVALAQGQWRPVACRPPGPLPPGRPGERDPAAAGAAADPPRGPGRGAGRGPVGSGPRHAAAPLEVPVVTEAPNGPWFTSLPPCETLVPCCQGRHVIRWEAGELRLASHSDPEAELVLAALGGEKARCVEIAEAWRRHTADLTVLGIGPRGPADEVAVSWDDVDVAAQVAQGGGVVTGYGARTLASPPRAAMARAAIRHRQHQQEAGEASQRRLDMLSLLALGTGFQVRLIGHVVAAPADRLDEPDE